MKEDFFINLIKESLPESSRFIGDDTAYIPDKDLILTQDTLIEDVHFRRSTISPYDLGIKAIAVNLSDIAASGGIPGYILVSLSLPENIEDKFVKDFYSGVSHICKKYNVLVVGGDLTRSSKITISVAVIGFSSGIKPASRSYAKSGNVVIVTGSFGSSGAGLWLLETMLSDSDKTKNIPKNISDRFIKSHINPVPQLEAGRTIVETCNQVPALMDTSDGLADALYKICVQSNVSMQIEYKDIPVDIDLQKIADIAQINPLKWVLFGGEDYQLVATVSENCFKKLAAKNLDIKVIGKVIPSDNEPAAYIRRDNQLIKLNASKLDAEIFSHFK